MAKVAFQIVSLRIHHFMTAQGFLDTCGMA
nr:MAG TPA: hypothetical protein [Caudoviricetes sp.]